MTHILKSEPYCLFSQHSASSSKQHKNPKSTAPNSPTELLPPPALRPGAPGSVLTRHLLDGQRTCVHHLSLLRSQVCVPTTRTGQLAEFWPVPSPFTSSSKLHSGQATNERITLKADPLWVAAYSTLLFPF